MGAVLWTRFKRRGVSLVQACKHGAHVLHRLSLYRFFIVLFFCTGLLFYIHTSHHNDMLEFCLFILTIAFIALLSGLEFRRVLAKTKASELVLKQERDNLEHILESRTRALRLAETERIAQLSRFAEFGKLSAGLFHYLLNPLTAVSLTVQRLKDNGDGAAKDTREAIQVAIDATKRMERFMDRIRRQLESGSTKTTFSAGDEIRSAIDFLSYKAKEKNVRCVFEERSVVSLYGDELKFVQAIINLIGNAIEAYENSGANDCIVRISLDSNQNATIIVVTDYGVGIAPKIAPRIFDPFFSTKEKGIGLGLATTKEVIEHEFGGTISFTSNGATVFTVQIPIAQSKYQESASS